MEEFGRFNRARKQIKEDARRSSVNHGQHVHASTSHFLVEDLASVILAIVPWHMIDTRDRAYDFPSPDTRPTVPNY